MAREQTIVITGDLSLALLRQMLVGFRDVALERGWIIHCVRRRSMFGRAAHDWNADGIVFSDNNIPKSLFGRLPIVGMGGPYAGSIASVGVDDQKVGAAAAEYLLGKGFRNFAMFGYWDCEWAIGRARGFADALAAAGAARPYLPWAAQGEVPTRVDKRSKFPQKPIEAWLKHLPKPIGIFAGCDNWGKFIIDLCRLGGFRVPEDVAVLGADDDDGVCELCSPPLSSVVIPWRQMGHEAALLMDRLINDLPLGPPTIALGPPGIISRRSTDTVDVDDPEVAAALAFIGSQSHRKITVAQILRAVPVSQHQLERKFKKWTGRRLLQEVRRVHVENAKRLLVSTELRMPIVAARAGFTNSSTLAIAFLRETGFTPMNYRRRFKLHL